MQILNATFVKSSANVNQCPKTTLPEYAFIGRSNVGKSSLINMLCGIKGLAKTSAKPGKTQLINHFVINNLFYLVDLPGYGFAKVPQKNRKSWLELITTYLTERKNLMNVFVLIDSRLSPQASDLDFMAFLSENTIPFSMVFTKTDKLSANELQKNIAFYKKTMLAENWESMPAYFITSAEKRTGKEEILKFIEQTNELYSNHTA